MGYDAIVLLLLLAATTQAPADTTASARGERDYKTYCAACHGARGNADGPVTQFLDPPPPRHSEAARMSTLSDAYLFRLLKEGGTAVGRSPVMTAWGRRLSDEQIWDLIAFMRTLAH